VRIDTDAQQAVRLPATDVDDPLSAFPQESKKPHEESGGGVVPGNARPTGIISHVKRALGTLDLVRDLAETVDSRFAALKSLDREIQDRAHALESLKQGILTGTGQADYVARLFMSLEPRLVALREQERCLRTAETTVAALENRARTVTTHLERHVDACEAREARAGHAVEQLGHRAADTITDLETRVDDCEARARTANEAIAHLRDVTTRTLPELQQRLKEADETNDLVDQRITEAARLATSLTALEQGLPEIARCEQQLARIELVVPQVERQLGDLDAGVERQIRALTVNQHQAEQTLGEAQKTDTLVSGLETRLADLSQNHQQLDAVEMRLGQLEQRAAGAATEFEQTSHARNTLEQKVIELQDHLRQMRETTAGETKKLVELTELAERARQEHARRASLVLSGLETQMADVGPGHRLLEQVEQQLRQLESRAAAAAAGLEQTSHAETDLNQEMVELQNQLRRLTASADDGAKRLVEIKQQAEGELHEQAQRVSAVLSELESRMAGVKSGHRLFDQVEQELGQLEARAVAAIAGVKRTTGVTNGLEQKVVELEVRLRDMTASADEEAKKLAAVTQQAERCRPERAVSPNRLVFGSIAAALAVTVVALLGSVWGFEAPPPPLPTSRALTFEPRVAVAPVTPVLIDDVRQLSNDNRPAPVQLAARVAQTVSGTAGEAGRTGTVNLPKQSVGTGGTRAQFTGRLLIESEPAGATAFVNEQPVGKTPVALEGLRVGSCVVRVEYEGYQRWSTAVSVSTTREAHVTATLKHDGNR